MTSYFILTIYTTPRWLSGRAFISHAGDRILIRNRDRPKSIKQVVTNVLPKAQYQVSPVLGFYQHILSVSQYVWHAE